MVVLTSIVPHQLLDGPNIVACFQQMCCKGMSEGMADGPYDAALFAGLVIPPAVQKFRRLIPLPLC